jgi:toxin ParE1/3/4
MLSVFETEESVEDVIGIGFYIASRTGLNVSAKVVSAIRTTYSRLAEFPGMGKLCDFQSEFPDLRSFTVSRYPTYIVFYRVQSDRIVIVRVLHGARNIVELFGD